MALTELSENNHSRNVKNANELLNQINEEQDIKYPKHVFFIISNEFCERFCFYGNKTILAIYLQSKLKYSEDDATVVYHIFVMLCYFFPIVGALLADCYWGKFRTILYLSMLYAVGNITLSAASHSDLAIDHKLFSLLGLLLIALGTGGIKPCVSSFGGDQFVLPVQETLLASFFSVFYFSINAGSLISTYLTPELRVMNCFGQDSCYPLAFGIPAALMVISIVFFICGKPLYKIKKPEGNIILDVSKCIGRGVWGKATSSEKKEHWVDYAADVYSSQLVQDTKILLELIYLFSPTILFWALYEQQGSRWTFQAINMNGHIWGYTIKPDQMQAVNPVLILAFIPLFDLAIYPLLAYLNLIKTSMQKLFWGGIIAAVAFGLSSYVEYTVQDDYAVLPVAGEAQLRIYNTYPCPLHIDAVYRETQYSWTVDSLDMIKQLSLPSSGAANMTYSAHLEGPGCPSLSPIHNAQLPIFEKAAVSYIATAQDSGSEASLDIVRIDETVDDLAKSDDGETKVKLLFRVSSPSNYSLTNIDGSSQRGVLQPGTHATDVFTLDSSQGYTLIVDGETVLSELSLGVGGVYSLLYVQNIQKGKMFTLTPANRVHILWQLPQIIVISIAEIMFSITGLEFSYSKAPVSMKSVISSLWLLTDSLGNVIIIVLSASTKNVPQVYMLSVFAVLMVLVMALFILLARRYTKVMKVLSQE